MFPSSDLVNFYQNCSLAWTSRGYIAGEWKAISTLQRKFSKRTDSMSCAQAWEQTFTISLLTLYNFIHEITASFIAMSDNNNCWLSIERRLIALGRVNVSGLCRKIRYIIIKFIERHVLWCDEANIETSEREASCMFWAFLNENHEFNINQFYLLFVDLFATFFYDFPRKSDDCISMYMIYRRFLCSNELTFLRNHESFNLSIWAEPVTYKKGVFIQI